MRHAEPVMGTVVSFDVRPGGAGRRAAAAALRDACDVLHAADRTFSLFTPDSPMSRVRRGELTVAHAPGAILEVLRLCARARALTDGWFDPWALPGGVDPTGMVKGWAARRAADALRAAGLPAAMVNAAGDIACFGRPEPGRSWTIGLQDPSDPRRILRTVAIEHAIATSGSAQRGPHLYDPVAGTVSPCGVSATVTGPDLALADALATAVAARGRAGAHAVDALVGYTATVY